MQYIHTPTQQIKTPRTPPKMPFPVLSRMLKIIIAACNPNTAQSPPQILHPLLHPKARIRLPQLLHLRVRQSLVHFLHIHQLLYGEDLTRDVGRDGVVDGAHALVQAEGFEDAAGFAWQTDGGAHEGDAEEGGCCWGGHCCVIGGCGFVWAGRC